VQSRDETIDMQDVHAFLPHWAAKIGDELYDVVFDISRLNALDIHQCGNAPPTKVKPRGPAPKIQWTSPISIDIEAGPIRRLEGSPMGLKTMTLKGSSTHSYMTKNRQYLWFVKDCVEAQCAPVSIQRPWSQVTEVNFIGNPTFGLLVVEGEHWNVAYRQAESAGPFPFPTPVPTGYGETLLLSKPIAVNYLFSPTRGEKGSVTFTLSAPSDVEIFMYDRQGRKIATVADTLFPAGKNTVDWNGRDESGVVVAPGAYSGRIVAGKQAYWFKLIVTR
jgi:hypothetical protein